MPQLAANGHRLAAQVQQGALDVIQASFYDVELDGGFDAVCYWDGFGIGTDADQERLLQRIVRWLAPHGRALIDISTPWFWQKAAGQAMQRGIAFRQYDYDVFESRLIDRWWLPEQPETAVSQYIRCYAPADLRLLLRDTGLSLLEVEPGAYVDYATNYFLPQASLDQAMSFLAILATHA